MVYFKIIKIWIGNIFDIPCLMEIIRGTKTALLTLLLLWEKYGQLGALRRQKVKKTTNRNIKIVFAQSGNILHLMLFI